MASQAATRSTRGTELLGLSAFALALMLLISLATFNPNDPAPFFKAGEGASAQNFIGPFGAFLAELLVPQLFGVAALLLPLVLGLTGWERYTRVVRAEVMALREKEFIEAARAIGVGRLRIIFRHILPNTVSSIVVMSTLQVAQAILAEAALSFLGVGSGRSYPTWGQMISLGRDFVTVAWWLPTLPGLAILLTVLAINLVGDRLRDALDPRAT